jgi:hypothetical protein
LDLIREERKESKWMWNTYTFFFHTSSSSINIMPYVYATVALIYELIIVMNYYDAFFTVLAIQYVLLHVQFSSAIMVMIMLLLSIQLFDMFVVLEFPVQLDNQCVV